MTPAPKLKTVMIGTLTFKPNLTLRQKQNRIKTIVPKFQQNVCLFRNFKIEYMVEYHKVDGIDDLEAPHVHFMIWIERPYNDRDYRAVLAYLSAYYGKCQYYCATGLRANAYLKYMQKDRKKYPDNYHTFSTFDIMTPEELEQQTQALREEQLIN